MSWVALVTLAFGVVALCATLLNAWVFWLLRSERRHLWLAVAALGVAILCVPVALLYGSQSVAEALLLRRIATVGLLVHSLGFFRFSELLLGVSLRKTVWIFSGTLLVGWAASFVPGMTYSGRPLVRTVLGNTYVDAESTALEACLFLVFGVLAVKLLLSYGRSAQRAGVGLRGAPAAALLWVGCTLVDLVTASGLVDLPFLLPLGYLGFVLAFTCLLLDRFVDAMTQAEARAQLLERLAEQRAQTLREKALQLAHGERLAAAGTLAAGLAHEINNPIAFVLANLNHLQALRKEENSEAEIEEVVLETQEGVERLRAIVDELLRLARRGERLSEPVQLARVVESVLPIVRHEAKGRVRIETNLAYAPLVSGDPGRLGQLVLNLIQNAIHALSAVERGGRVSISVAPVAAGVELLVEDDGPGIPDDVLPHIFEPFFTTKASGAGTGLGLAVTREIVSRHGGTIEVETGSAGTRFRVTLPAAPAGTAV